MINKFNNSESWLPLLYKSPLGIEHDLFIHSKEELDMYLMNDPTVPDEFRLYQTHCIHLYDEDSDNQFDPWYVGDLKEFNKGGDMEKAIIESVLAEANDYNESVYCKSEKDRIDITHIFYPLMDQFITVHKKDKTK